MLIKCSKFKVNFLTLNFSKTWYLEFRTKNCYNVNTQIKYDQECITSTSEIKFLGLTIDGCHLILETTHRTGTQQNVHCMLSTEEHKTYSTNLHPKSNIFCSYTLNYNLWYNFLG